MLLREVESHRRLLRIENEGSMEAEFLPDRSLDLLRLKCRGVSVHSPFWNELDGPLLSMSLPGDFPISCDSLYPFSESKGLKWRGSGRVSVESGAWRWNRLIRVEQSESSLSLFDRFEPFAPGTGQSDAASGRAAGRATPQDAIEYAIQLGPPLIAKGSTVLVGNANAGVQNGKGSQRFPSERLDWISRKACEQTDFFPRERPYERPSVFVAPPEGAGESGIRMQITWDPFTLPHLTEQYMPYPAAGEGILLCLKLSGHFGRNASGDTDNWFDGSGMITGNGFTTSLRISVGAYGEDLR